MAWIPCGKNISCLLTYFPILCDLITFPTAVYSVLEENPLGLSQPAGGGGGGGGAGT